MLYWLLGLYKGENKCFPIGLEARTKQDAVSGYNWQLQGQGSKDDYCIATRTGETTFKCVKTGTVYQAENGGFTPQAWTKFLTSYKA